MRTGKTCRGISFATVDSNVPMVLMSVTVSLHSLNTEHPVMIDWIFLGYCQGDIYACLQGNNVSCRLACPTYGRVTCLTYQNTRACEQYLRERKLINRAI